MVVGVLLQLVLWLFNLVKMSLTLKTFIVCGMLMTNGFFLLLLVGSDVDTFFVEAIIELSFVFDSDEANVLVVVINFVVSLCCLCSAM